MSETPLPLYVTKFFNAEKNWNDYSNGSFKIGTLSSYRGTESNALTRMTDQEGILNRHFGSGDGTIENLQVRGVSIRDCSFAGGVTWVNVQSEIDENVFCCTLGPYDLATHAKILHGHRDPIGGDYEGNSDLDAYAVIELRKFLQGLRFWSASSPLITSKLSPFNHIAAKSVRYGGDRSVRYDIDEITNEENAISSEEYERVVFDKPSFFSVEKEFRIVLSRTLPIVSFSPLEPLYPQSRRLKNSVVQMGRWVG
ncbi:hypothetical protein [uncultured Tateyamaria sp.]|uniref:hypothetical protein n=1 Tax=uncultured Tateyamaria sp. TaxID=455651 RepID=UPI0026378BF1|nr:hypothetical protein [uncultured Tateyamaria sp.]